jgi:hypothetical protein
MLDNFKKPEVNKSAIPQKILSRGETQLNKGKLK